MHIHIRQRPKPTRTASAGSKRQRGHTVAHPSARHASPLPCDLRGKTREGRDDNAACAEVDCVSAHPRPQGLGCLDRAERLGHVVSQELVERLVKGHGRWTIKLIHYYLAPGEGAWKWSFPMIWVY